MHWLDIRTILFGHLLTSLICVTVIILTWSQTRRHFSGVGFLVLGYLLQLAGTFLTILREAIPDIFSIVLSNTLILAGALSIYMGLEKYTGRKTSQRHNYVLLLCFIGVHIYFTYVQPDLSVRNLNFSAGLFILWSQGARLMLCRVDAGKRSSTRIVGWALVGFCFLNALRILDFFFVAPEKTAFFQPRAFDALIMIFYQIFLIFLTYSLVLMINKTLLDEIGEEEEKFSRTFLSSPYAAMLMELNSGHILNVNRTFLKITGYLADEMIGKSVMDLQLWRDDHDRMTVFRDLTERGTIPERDFQFRKKTGEIYEGTYSAEVINVKGRKCVISNIDDITNRKRFLGELQRSETFLKSIVEQSPYPMWISDKSGTLIAINKACEETFRLNAEEVVGKYNILRDNIISEQGYMSSVRAVYEKGTMARFDLSYDTFRLRTLKFKNRAVLVLDTTIFPVKDPQGNVSNAVIQFMDITAKRRMEDEIRKLNLDLEQKVEERTRSLHDTQSALLNLVDDLEKTTNNLAKVNESLTAANRELEAFSYSASHDLRAPLRSIEGFSKAMLEDYYDKLDAQGRDYLERIQQGAKKMDWLVKDLLKLSKINQSDMNLQEINLSEMAKAIIRDKQETDPHAARQVNIQENILIRGDRRLLQIVLTNLLDNAWKFTAKAEGPWIEFGTMIKDGKNVILVRDNGVGFDMAYGHKLFGVFQRLHNTEEFPGTGIGLATVKRIVHRHGGQIWAEGDVGKGAAFYFTLPGGT